MPVDDRRPRRRWLATWGLLVAAVVAPLFLLAPSASADVTEVDECSPTPQTGCLTPRLPNGVEVEGIEFEIVPPSGEPVTVTSDEAGVAYAEVDEGGQYEVSIVLDSLPDGVEMLEDAPTTITPNVTLGKQITPLFNVRADDYEAETPFSEELAQSAASGLRLGLLLALGAIGLSLIYGTTGLSSFSHAEQVTLGGIVCYLLVQTAGVNFWLALALTIVICGATGYLQDRLMWQPLRHRGLGLVQMMIVTIGLSLALQYAFQAFVGRDTVRILTDAPETVEFGPVVITVQSLIAMGLAAAVIVLVSLALLYTRIGRATRAVSDNPALASASGIDVDRVVRLVWVVSTALAGMAGVMLALVLNGVKWNSGMQILLLLFAAVTLGGLGTAFGALIGALIIGMMVELTPILGLPGDLKYATALLLLILLLLVRPQGILGKAQRVG